MENERLADPFRDEKWVGLVPSWIYMTSPRSIRGGSAVTPTPLFSSSLARSPQTGTSPAWQTTLRLAVTLPPCNDAGGVVQ